MNQHPGTLEGWTHLAACKGQTELFFIRRGDTIGVQKAKAICSNCQVLDNCRSYVMFNPERFGVWAGMTEKDRRRYREETGIKLPAAQHGTRSRYNSGCRCFDCRSVYNRIMRTR